MTVAVTLSDLLFGYPQPAEMIDPRFPVFLQCASGLALTMLVTGASLIGGGAIGVALALCRREGAAEAGASAVPSRLIGIGAGAVVELIRGLPIAILVLLTFYLPYPVLGIRLPETLLAIAAFSLYAGVYLCEIIRSGLRSIPGELWQAGRVLGLRPRQIFLRLELPLICRTMAPDLINLVITLFKDSSALAIVAVSELTYVGKQMVMSEPGSYGSVVLLVLLLYWFPATVLSSLALNAQRRGDVGTAAKLLARRVVIG